MKYLITICLSTFCLQNTFAQTTALKKSYTEEELVLLDEIFNEMMVKDQEYRTLISNNTLDKNISYKIDSVFNQCGIAEGFAYKKSLKSEKLPQSTLDSLWKLQHKNDLNNHLILKGVFETYGYIPEEIIGESYTIQIMVLMHPPGNWDIASYHKSYSELLFPEVLNKRMPAKIYAIFYDNMLTKILDKPQLYGTGKHFDSRTKKELPAIIENIDKTNEARITIGLAPLEEGEYRLSTDLH